MQQEQQEQQEEQQQQQQLNLTDPAHNGLLQLAHAAANKGELFPTNPHFFFIPHYLIFYAVHLCVSACCLRFNFPCAFLSLLYSLFYVICHVVIDICH